MKKFINELEDFRIYNVSYEQTVIHQTSFNFYDLESTSRQVRSFEWVVQKLVHKIPANRKWDLTEANDVQGGREKEHCYVSQNLFSTV